MTRKLRFLESYVEFLAEVSVAEKSAKLDINNNDIIK